MALTGKVAFITGAAQGIGKALSQALLERGVKVFLVDRNAPVVEATAMELETRFGQDMVRFVALDVTKHQEFTDVFDQAVSTFGHVDIMVNNAAVLQETDWQQTIQVNLVALIHGTRLATEHMRKDKGGQGGRIINVCSNAGLELREHLPTYCSSKHAVRAYTASLAKNPNTTVRGIEYGILCPTGTNTPFLNNLVREGVHTMEELQGTVVKSAMPPAGVAEGLIELLQLEKMNGAMLLVEKTARTYVTMEYKPVEVIPK